MSASFHELGSLASSNEQLRMSATACANKSAFSLRSQPRTPSGPIALEGSKDNIFLKTDSSDTFKGHSSVIGRGKVSAAKVWLAEWCKIQGIKITSNINNQSTVQHFLSRSTITSVQFQRLIQQPKLKTRPVTQQQQQLLSSTTTNQITSKPRSKQSQLQQQTRSTIWGRATGYGRGRLGPKISYGRARWEIEHGGWRSR